MRFPDNRGAAVRSQALVEPADLWATLLDYWGLGDGCRRRRPPACCPRRGARSPCTATGSAPAARPRSGPSAPRPGISAAPGEPELFAKPDDYWEANNVALRCREVVECLEDALVEFEQTLQVGQTADLPPLSDVLLNGME